MKYFSIQHSLNSKILGHYPQVKSYKYHCDIWNDPKFIEQVQNTQVDFEPITANAILHTKSKVTDLIDAGGVGFTLKPLVSQKFKNILENSKEKGLQFFKSPIIFKENLIDDYFVLNMYQNENNLIDIKNSKIRYDKKSDDYKFTFKTETEHLFFDNYEIFSEALHKALDNNELFYIEKIKLKENIQEDFFMLKNVEGGLKYVVSEKLKKEIEDAECTGIEFQPIELSLSEWLHGGEREKIYGKAI
ncbi:imm11 family protein [Flavobacterium sp. DG2-3]|uniref:imm11 family protein n=1 Tax=Flavobacterium sp. DG2-3 TaxID=3068317 RepID=UPI0027401633|nr:DUF1629 domain-containing protein [Flavobacterium sp. DG2-3]MDP5201331.1 hypothetical protein [Flavobacterium sp. DG2-3]